MSEHVAQVIREVAARYPDRVATRIRVGDEWVTQTFSEFVTRINAVAKGLIDAGVQPGDRVAIFANNRPEWSEIDYGTLSARAILVPIYATSTVDQIAHIMRDSGAKVLFVGGRSEAERVLEAREQLPELERVITIDAFQDQPGDVALLADFMRFGDTAEVDAQLAGASGDELASIIYTSGTTGDPKGVMTPNSALVRQKEALDQFFTITPDDHSLAFLPLSHSLERAWTFVVLAHGCMNTYVPNAREVADQLVLAQPTLMVSVPKLYETVFKTAHAKVAKSAAKRAIFSWAFRVGGRLQRAYRKGKQPSSFWKAQLGVADKLVFRNIREAMGGPKTVLACGGAPLRQEIEEFFSAAGMLVCQGYGLTEASPLVSFNAPDGFKFGTCGRVLPGGELHIGTDGEILYRGPNVMTGYWNHPEASDEALRDGWLHTGDVGYVDTDGYLVITDRLKDIIVTLGGKNVAPQPIEGMVLADPLFEHAVLLGDNRPCLTLLVKPSLPAVEEMAKRLQWPGDMPEWLQHPELIDEIRQRISHLTAKLPSQEQIRDTLLLTDEFTMDNGLLTPTLKVKRREVEKRFKDLVDSMYERLAERRRQE